MAITVDQIPNIVYQRGYKELADTYTEVSERWRAFIPATHIQAPSAENLGDFPYGARWLNVVGLGDMREVDDFQPAPDSTTAEGYTRQMRLIEFADSITIPARMMEARNAESDVTGRVLAFARRSAANASLRRNKIVAGMMQKGTLAAGSTAFFRQDYHGQPDANVGFIYDGNPWFSASGAAHPFKAHTATGSQGVNLLTPGGLSTTTLNTAYEAASSTNAIDERGERAGGPLFLPKYLVVGAGMRQTALSVAGSPLIPGSGNNDINAYNGLVSPVIWNDLSDDANAWWLVSDDPGVMAFDTGIPSLETIVDSDRRTVKIVSMFRFGFVVTDWRGMTVCDKATS